MVTVSQSATGGAGDIKSFIKPLVTRIYYGRHRPVCDLFRENAAGVIPDYSPLSCGIPARECAIWKEVLVLLALVIER